MCGLRGHFTFMPAPGSLPMLRIPSNRMEFSAETNITDGRNQILELPRCIMHGLVTRQRVNVHEDKMRTVRTSEASTGAPASYWLRHCGDAAEHKSHRS